MNTFERIYSVFSILFAGGFFYAILSFAELRELVYLLPLTGLALIINMGLLFVVFRDISCRTFPNPTHKYVWFALILFLFPTILVYLPMYGFKKR